MSDQVDYSWMNIKRIRREKLWARQGGACCYCNRHTKLIRWPGDAGTPPDDMATLEHLFHAFDDRRKFLVHDGPRYAVACYGCNQRKGREDALKFRACGSHKTKQEGIPHVYSHSTDADPR